MFTNALSDPSVEGLLVNSRDVTERKQAEEMHKEKQAADAANQAKSAFPIVSRGWHIHLYSCSASRWHIVRQRTLLYREKNPGELHLRAAHPQLKQTRTLLLPDHSSSAT